VNELQAKGCGCLWCFVVRVFVIGAGWKFELAKRVQACGLG